ncbi:MAG TPA: alpha-ketoglutarate-dependent dioxygenase AlkB [Anditalea sp.]|nr:alpha-ketoglutarate-dependent dioxygenase AlkB [Anditalea sp.]
MENHLDNLLPSDGEVYYFPDFFTHEESFYFFNYLKQNVPWRQEPIKIFGKEIMQPRLTALYGDPAIPYSYSGIQMVPHPFTDQLLKIKHKVELLAGVTFTHALLNYYRNGRDSMGWHRDNEKSLGTEPVIGSVSFGASRSFQLRHYIDKKPKISIALGSGSYLLMKGQTQQHWEHQVPKTQSMVEERINLTFRVITN